MLFKINLPRVTRKLRYPTSYTWYDNKLDRCHKALTVANLLIVNVYSLQFFHTIFLFNL